MWDSELLATPSDDRSRISARAIASANVHTEKNKSVRIKHVQTEQICPPKLRRYSAPKATQIWMVEGDVLPKLLSKATVLAQTSLKTPPPGLKKALWPRWSKDMNLSVGMQA